MKTNRAGIELLKKWEGCRLTAYRDSVGVLTIGYGLTSAAGIIKVTEGLTITQEQADEYLVKALVKYEAAVKKALTRAPNENQYSAMVSLCYNIGPGAFAKSSVVRLFNEGDAKGAADAFRMWNKAGGKVLKGLVSRREDERALFLRPVAAKAAKVPHDEPILRPPPDIEPVDAEKASDGVAIAKLVMGAVGFVIAALAAWLTVGG